MKILADMKADAEICNERMRQSCGISSFEMAANQSGYKPKRSPAVMARREEVWAMYQTGMTQVQIAKETGLTVSTVKSDCAQMRREKRKAA